MKAMLKRCPWCESFELMVGSSDAFNLHLYWVKCCKCGASGPDAKSSPWAIRKWNKVIRRTVTVMGVEV